MMAIGTFAAALGYSAVHAAAGRPGDGSDPARTIAHEVVPFSRIPGWRDDDHAAAFVAFRRSCPAIVKRAAALADTSATALAAVCTKAIARGDRRIGRAEARIFFERFFVPRRVANLGAPGLFTGYYEPHIEGSLTRTARFSVPLYRRPPDLENVVPEESRARTGIAYSHLRRTATGLVPYATRAEIDAGALSGQGLEVVWLADPVEAFFAQVQGSARILLPDGRRVGLAYDGKNGHPYTSIGRVLIDRGAMTADQMSMPTLGAWLRADAARGREVLHHNSSYVFFRLMPSGDGASAQGALGVPLTTGRSLAVDTAFHQLGTPIFVEAPRLRHWGGRGPFRRLMVAQDVGSAIKGVERGDIYFGSGARAAARAGITKHGGSFIVFHPRSSL